MKRGLVERLFADALEELDVAERVRAALSARPARPARVIAVGKVAPAMAMGAMARWGQAIERCMVVAPDGIEVEALERAAQRARIRDRLVVMRAGHPLPDARSIRAGAACLEAVRSDEPRTLVMLVSGGASALVCAPALGVTLARKRAITRVMLVSGASIQDLNVVRKHLSRIKGGGLLRAAGANEVRTLIASDVIGGTAVDVGSGPSVPDVTSVTTARQLVRRFAPAFADVPLVKTYAPAPAVAKRARASILVSPEELARTMATLLRSRGLHARILPPSQATVEELAAEYVALVRRAVAAGSRWPRAFVRAAEPSVTVTVASPSRPGRGGRSTHLAALVGRALGELAERERNRATFAALATDGVDGRSAAGGAVIDGSFASRVAGQLGKTALDRSLVRFDTGPLHRAVDTAVAMRATGHNLADLHVLVVT